MMEYSRTYYYVGIHGSRGITDPAPFFLLLYLSFSFLLSLSLCLCLSVFVYIYIYVYIYVFTQPLCLCRMRNKVILKQSLTGLNSEFSFFMTGCHIKIKVASLLNYLSIAEEGKIGFIPFPSAASPRFCTRVTVIISYSGYTTDGSLSLSLSIYIYIYIYI